MVLYVCDMYLFVRTAKSPMRPMALPVGEVDHS